MASALLQMQQQCICQSPTSFSSGFQKNKNKKSVEQLLYTSEWAPRPSQMLNTWLLKIKKKKERWDPKTFCQLAIPEILSI